MVMNQKRQEVKYKLEELEKTFETFVVPSRNEIHSLLCVIRRDNKHGQKCASGDVHRQKFGWSLAFLAPRDWPTSFSWWLLKLCWLKGTHYTSLIGSWSRDHDTRVLYHSVCVGSNPDTVICQLPSGKRIKFSKRLFSLDIKWRWRKVKYRRALSWDM